MSSDNTVPAVSDLSERGELLPPGDSFPLLTKPTLDLTRADIIAIANDLRAKRTRFLAGQGDKTTVVKRVAAPKPTEEQKAQKAAVVKDLLAGLKL